MHQVKVSCRSQFRTVHLACSRQNCARQNLRGRHSRSLIQRRARQCRCAHAGNAGPDTELSCVCFTVIIDDIIFPNGATLMGVLGGGGEANSAAAHIRVAHGARNAAVATHLHIVYAVQARNRYSATSCTSSSGLASGWRQASAPLTFHRPVRWGSGCARLTG